MSDRRSNPGPITAPPPAFVRLCTRCGYDLSLTRPAIDHDVWKCPECGWLTTQTELDAARSPRLREWRSVLLVVTVMFNTLIVAPIALGTVGPALASGVLLAVCAGEAAFLHWLAWPSRRLDQGFRPVIQTGAILLGFPVVLWLALLGVLRLI